MFQMQEERTHCSSVQRDELAENWKSTSGEGSWHSRGVYIFLSGQAQTKIYRAMKTKMNPLDSKIYAFAQGERNVHWEKRDCSKIRSIITDC